MRYIIFLVPFFLHIKSNGQEHNFLIEDSQLVWQKVFENTQPSYDLISALDKQFAEVSHRNDSVIIGQLSRVVYTAYLRSIGRKWANTSPYLFSAEWYARATIEFKDNRYRVTLTNIISDTPGSTMFDGPETDKAITLKNEFRKSWLKNIASYLDKCFTNQFDVSEEEIQNDDW